MEVTENVYVMNERTWELWESQLMDRASEVERPLPYLRIVSMIDVLIDISLPNYIVEVYCKHDEDYLGDEEQDYWWDK